MFERARLTLTAWYVGALVLTVVGIGAVSYRLLRDDLQSEIDDSLQTAARELSATGGLVPAAPSPTPTPDAGGSDDHDDDEDHDDDSGHDDDDEHASDDERLRLISSEVFYLVFDASGTVLSNPRRVDVGAIDLLAAASRGDAPQDAGGDGEEYRLVVEGLGDGAFLAVGRSLGPAQHQLETLTTVTVLGGIVALAAALGSGWWLAGRTLRPIRESLELQRRFVSDASHELRTPLAVARANTSLLLEDPEASVESHLEQAEAVASELEHLGVLVADLTTLARADEGRGNLMLAPMDLGALTEEVARDMLALADVRGVRLESETGPSPVNGDTVRLRQLLMILVDNALKYAPPGGLVRVRCGSAHGHVDLSVSDNGAGISEQDQKHIFDRFYRSDSERTRSKGGTGLGLAIGKWIAEAHGGRIAVESVPGKGTTFRVRLPAK